MEINKASFGPENYILLGSSDTLMTDAEVLISEIKASRPEQFEGNRAAFSFEFRYAAPFDKDFRELKRLQGTAAEAAGRRSQFKGYIMMDMKDWLSHHDEAYLNKALLFLIDMSDCWKYIFLIDNQNVKAARALVGKILTVFFHDHIPCGVREENEKCACKGRVSTLCKTQGVMCAPPVKGLFQEILEQKFSESIVVALLSELSGNSGKELSMNTLVDFMMNQESVVRYMLGQKEYNRLLTIIEKRKEHWYGEKEAV